MHSLAENDFFPATLCLTLLLDTVGRRLRPHPDEFLRPVGGPCTGWFLAVAAMLWSAGEALFVVMLLLDLPLDSWVRLFMVR